MKAVSRKKYHDYLQTTFLEQFFAQCIKYIMAFSLSLLILLMICFCSIIYASSSTSLPLATDRLTPPEKNQMHHYWKKYLDRKYSLSNWFNVIHNLAGKEGKVIEVGAEEYNCLDPKLAGVDPDLWWFVDIVDRSHCQIGHTYLHPEGFNGLRDGNFKGKFRVVLDNTIGVIANHSMHEPDVSRHLDLYSEILEPGGWVLMRYDGWNRSKLYIFVDNILFTSFSNAGSPAVFPAILNHLKSKFVLVHQHFLVICLFLLQRVSDNYIAVC